MATPNLQALTNVSPKHLGTPAQQASGEQTFYQVPASKAAQIKSFALTNTSTAAVTVAVSVVPSGTAPGPTNRCLAAYPLAAGDSMRVDEAVGMWLGEAAVISINSSAGAAIVPTVTGLEFT